MGILNPGDVEVRNVYLIDPKKGNQVVNLFGLFNEVRIYESIHTAKLNGYIVLTESKNLIINLPITGNEILEVEFLTPGLPLFKHSFVITSVGMREHQDKHNAYALHFISLEAHVALNTRVSRAFSGNPSDIARSVYKTYFKHDMTEIDPSINNIKFISPYWDPLKIITHVSRLALLPSSTMKTPNYLFYESHRGHRFKSITNLFKQEPITTFFFNKNPGRDKYPDGTSVNNLNIKYANALTLTFLEAPCLIKNTMQGAYNTTVFGFNYLNKKFTISNYNTRTDFNKTLHLDKNPLTPNATPYNAGVFLHKATYPNMFDNVDDLGDSILTNTVPLLAQLDSYIINMEVHGRTDIEVGKLAYVILNQHKVVDQKDDKNLTSIDHIYSGKYLISKIEHTFTQVKHRMNLELIKDAGLTKVIS